MTTQILRLSTNGNVVRMAEIDRVMSNTENVSKLRYGSLAEVEHLNSLATAIEGEADVSLH